MDAQVIKTLVFNHDHHDHHDHLPHDLLPLHGYLHHDEYHPQHELLLQHGQLLQLIHLHDLNYPDRGHPVPLGSFDLNLYSQFQFFNLLKSMC